MGTVFIRYQEYIMLLMGFLRYLISNHMYSHITCTCTLVSCHSQISDWQLDKVPHRDICGWYHVLTECVIYWNNGISLGGQCSLNHHPKLIISFQQINRCSPSKNDGHWSEIEKNNLNLSELQLFSQGRRLLPEIDPTGQPYISDSLITYYNMTMSLSLTTCI